MTTPEFNKLVSDRCEKIRAVLAAKATEYARGDRLSNFKRGSESRRLTPERICDGMRLKHEVSVVQLIEDLDAGNVNTLELWQEKLGDNINYLILLEALVTERFHGILMDAAREHHRKGGRSHV